MAGSLVLITGATGMIGFRTLVLLLQSGQRARVAVRNQAGLDRITSLKPLAPYLSQIESFIVPDITVPGAYDEAVKGVEYILHIASPLADPKAEDPEKEVIQPAVQGTVGILESAIKTSGVKRIAITASALSIASLIPDGTVVNEQTRTATTSGPYTNPFVAYAASKAKAFQATQDFITTKNPPFDVVNILPTYVLGRDDTVTEASSIAKGTNGLLMGPLLGHARDLPLQGVTVHVDDVAELLVKSLDPKIPAGEYLSSSQSGKGTVWGDSFDIVRKNFPKQVEEGVFPLGDALPPTLFGPADSSKAEKAFGIKFKTFEEQVLSVAGHFLELSGKQ